MNPEPDPEFQVNLDPDSGFWWPKFERKIHLKNVFCLFVIKTCNLLIPRPPEKRPSYRRSFQYSKETIDHFKKWNLLTFLIFVGHICPPGSGSGSGSRNPIESRSGSTTPHERQTFVETWKSVILPFTEKVQPSSTGEVAPFVVHREMKFFWPESWTTAIALRRLFSARREKIELGLSCDGSFFLGERKPEPLFCP